jgi:hypothetical protein
MTLKDGDRIRMIEMGRDPVTSKPDPCPIEPGDTGTIIGNGVSWRDGSTQYNVKWDSGRSLGIIIPPDTVEKIDG